MLERSEHHQSDSSHEIFDEVSGLAEMIQTGDAKLEKGWWQPERAPSGDWFVWGGAAAELVVPVLPPATRLEIDLAPRRGDSFLDVTLNGTGVARVEGHAPRRRYWTEEVRGETGKESRLAFLRPQGYPDPGRDSRALSVQLFGVRAVGPSVGWAAMLASEEDRHRALITATGLFGPEVFPEGRGVWTQPTAKMFLPAGAGTLTVTLWAPRPSPPLVEFDLGGKTVAGPTPVGHEPSQIEIAIAPSSAASGGIELGLKATPFCPAQEGDSTDTRQLGVVLGRVRFIPSGL